ncbi:MAG: SDR family oxidoreductase [Betaproteobacteria bacterium]|nr:SDR family oxidoreductase [Betaproteobacteria bacterium]
MSAAESASARVAIVTGASKGIGQGIAEKLAKDGLNVCVHYGGDQAGASETARRIESGGGRAHLIRADVANAAEVENMFAQVMSHFGRLDVVVNNAGIINSLIPLVDVQEADFDRVMETNTKGAFLMMREAAKRLKHNGRIICVTTSLCVVPRPGFGVYVASKAAVEGLMRVLARELAPKKITVNAVAPGPVDTAMLRKGKTQAQLRQIAELSPMNRVGTTEEIASVVSFLASSGASWVTGQVVHVNGGLF